MRWVAAARPSISGDRFLGALAGLLDGAGGLPDLPADFLDRSGEFFGGAGDGGHVAGRLFGGAGGRDRASARVRRDTGNGLGGATHRGRVVGDRAQHAADRFPEGIDRRFGMAGARIPCLGILHHLRIEVAVAVHRVLEDLDGARQSTDLVAAAGVGNLDPLSAFGDALDGVGNDRERARDRTGDHQHADHDDDQRKTAETGQNQSHDVVGVGLQRQLLAALGIDPGKRLEILVQRRTHFAVGVVVAPFASRRRIDLDAAAHQFLAEVDELFDALLEGGELLGVVGLDQRLPVLDHVEDALVELEQPFAVLLHDRRIGRHVDAAGFHHHRIDQRIDPLDIERGAARGRDRVRERGILARVVVGQRGNGGDQDREQGENRIQFGRERKPGGHAGTRK